jgi:hypothetical protein
VTAEERHERVRPVAKVEQVKAVAPSQAQFVRQKPGQKFGAIPGHAGWVGDRQFRPDRERRTLQCRVEAVMIFAENLQREPAFEFPQRHGGASLGRIVGPGFLTSKMSFRAGYLRPPMVVPTRRSTCPPKCGRAIGR